MLTKQSFLLLLLLIIFKFEFAQQKRGEENVIINMVSLGKINDNNGQKNI